MAKTALAKVTQQLPWSNDEHDPIALLEADHRRFEELLKRGEESTSRAVKGRREILHNLTAALNVHELIEERELYPTLEPHAAAREVVLEGYEEHHVADLLLSELAQVAEDDEKWGAKFKVLKESIEHHIAEEERRMFPIARAELSADELKALGARMRALRSQAQSR